MSALQSHRRRKKNREKIGSRCAGDETGIPAGRGSSFAFPAGVVQIIAAANFFRQFLFRQTAGAAAAQFLRLIEHSFSGPRHETPALIYPFNLRAP